MDERGAEEFDLTRQPILWSRRGRSVLLLICGCSVFFAGCHRARKRLLDDNYQLYARAQAALADRQYQKAIRELGDIGLVNPIEADLDPQIKLTLADSYFFQPGLVNVVEAQSRYEQFLSFYPLHEKAPYARYQIGACLFQQSEDPENDQEFTYRALEHFQAMVRDLPPEDPWREAALVMVHKAQDKLAAHEWDVAMFYKKKDKNLGLIQRLQQLVDSYPNSRFREQAFLELATAYQAAGDLRQARLNLDRLLSEYPAGKLRQQAETLRGQVVGKIAAEEKPEKKSENR